MEHERAVQNLAVESYLLGEMTPAERESFEEHYFECAICAEDLRAASHFMEEAKQLLAEEEASADRSASVPRRETRKESGWAWLAWLNPEAAAAMIAVLGVVIGVQTLSTIPGLRRQIDASETPRVVKSVVLKAVTRGDAAAVRAGAGEPVVLVFDPPEAPDLRPGTPIRFIVKASDGHSIFDLPGETPAVGERITLSLPRFNAPPGDYTLIVESAGSAGGPRELGQYPFKLER